MNNIKPEFETIQAVHRAWADVLDMCEGTDIATNACWRFNGKKDTCSTPGFAAEAAAYTFAVCLIPDAAGKLTPVFAGDVVYNEVGIAVDAQTVWRKMGLEIKSHFLRFSLTLPRMTITLNGVELVAPDGEDFCFYIANTAYCWNAQTKRDECLYQLHKLMTSSK